jgi:hypothetical protein
MVQYTETNETLAILKLGKKSNILAKNVFETSFRKPRRTKPFFCSTLYVVSCCTKFSRIPIPGIHIQIHIRTSFSLAKHQYSELFCTPESSTATAV